MIHGIIIFLCQADGKQAPKLANSIAKFKEDLIRLGNDPNSVFFIFWQIGDNKEDDFFDRLDRDERIHDIVCCRKENLAKRMNADLKQGGNYNGQVSVFSHRLIQPSSTSSFQPIMMKNERMSC